MSRALRVLKKIKSRLFSTHLKKRVVCEHEWYGGKYTGFYVHPNVLNKDSIVYSFGVGEDTSFDQKVIDRHGCCVWAFDPTPKSINWVKGNVKDDRFIFYEYGLSSRSDMVDFYLPKNIEHVSGSAYDQGNVDTKNKITVEMKSLEDILAMTKHNHIDLLKMDIEGSEYDVIESILGLDIKIGQLQIEFHDRFFKDGESRTKMAVKQLEDSGYKVFAVSKSKEEVSFIHESVIE